MYQPLVPCTDCRRHILAVEGACPFCGTTRAATSIETGPLVRMSRAAAIAAMATLAACQSEPQPTPIAKDPIAVKPEPTPKPEPVKPPEDAGLVDDHGGMMTKYGAPPPPKPPPPKPHPIAVPAYGLPPAPHPTPLPK